MKLAAVYLGDNTLRIQDDNPKHNMRRGQQYILDVHVGGDRNIGHHRKFWAMLRFFSDFLDHPMSDTSLKAWAVIGAGYFDIAPDGTLLAHSIAFDQMPQAEFERLYSAALDYLLRAVAPNMMTRSDVEEALRFA